jgi:hypothetical protein
MASTYLTRTFGSAGNRQSWTWSGWIKKSKVYNSSASSDREVWFGGYSASNDTDWLEFGTQGDILFATSSATSTTSTQVLRDVNGWYHALVNYNGSNLKFYINNELFKDSTDFSGNRGINVAGKHTIGAIATDQSIRRFNGVMSHVNFIDGTVYIPSAFGEYDANGVWKIKTSPSVTYGTNGFFILKDGNSVTDQSGNGNNFTVAGGTLTNTEDSPSNVFATLNPIHLSGTQNLTNLAFSNGNNTVTSTQAGSPYPFAFSTLGASSGKWYAEFKTPSSTSSTMGISTGVGAGGFLGGGTNEYAIFYNGNFYNNGSGSSTGYDAWSDNDILGVALDLDNNKIYFHKNGTYMASGDPAGNSGGNSITAPSSNGTGVYHFACGDAGSGTPSVQANFGNGYFGTTAVSSAGTNASGIGIFEYDVPTGYTALSTKGLNL